VEPDFRSALLDHFEASRRPLPWRSERTPHRVIVSDFMLQQTRADTVVPYYQRWLRRFPEWDALARASPDDVMLAWKGLGYYRRAGYLQQTAKIVLERYGGRLPDDVDTLKTLPGVGEYTAGAVASIAFGMAAPAVDGNVRRVLCRLLDEGDPSPARLRAEAGRLLDPKRPGDFNEAMMELGATVCLRRSPRCDECPVAAWCRARAAGSVANRPLPKARRRPGSAHYAVAVAVAPTGETLLVRRPDNGVLARMWEFPAAEIAMEIATRAATAGNGSATGGGDPIFPALLESRAAACLAEAGVIGQPAGRFEAVKHAFTHLRLTYHPVIVRCSSATPRQCPTDPGRLAWVHASELDTMALPVAQQKIGSALVKWLASQRPETSPVPSATVT